MHTAKIVNRNLLVFSIFFCALWGLGLKTRDVYGYYTCAGGSSACYCSSGTSSCPCPDGTCYIHCTKKTCSDCIKRDCSQSGCPIIGTCTCTTSIDSTYPNGSHVSCCTQITCTCNPSCPEGTSATVTGSLCSAGNASCSQSNECSSCTKTGSACYYPETNTTFIQSNGSTAGPTSVSMIVEGTTYNLSTDPNNPTKIKLPCTTNVSVTAPTFVAPTTSRGGGYYFTANNYGVNDEWKTWVSCSGTVGEDFCKDTGTNNTTTFTPTTQSIPIVLKEGAKGKISAQYYTINKCDDNKKYSIAREGYYEVETNIPVSAPTSTNITIDNKTYTLSSNPATPTMIKIPSSVGGTAQLTEPTFSLPSYSQSQGYAFTSDNYGINNQWLGGSACTGITGEDFCIENTINTQTFTPATKTVAEVLKANAKGKISSKYYTTNRCGNNKQYSTSYDSYYQVESEPTCIDCSTDSSSILPEITEDLTAKECNSTTYTGKDINNPLHFNVDITDENGISDIRGLIVWFSKDTSTPATVAITGSTPNADVMNDIGIFIQKNGSGWDTPFMYGYDSETGNWEQTTDGNIKNSENEVGMKIENVTITPGSSSVNFDFKLELFTVNTNPQGIYNLYLNGVDTYMINNNVVDQSRLTKYFNWGIDLVDPTVEDITQQIIDPTNTNLTWSVNDSTSGIKRTVINGYRIGGTEIDIAQLYLPTTYTINKGNIALNAEPPSTGIGMYNDSNAWKFDDNTGETDKLNIGTNESGKIEIYVTGYDQACNTDSTGEEINLNPWFATRGGTVYSQKNISSEAKPVSGVPTLDGVFNSKTLMDKTLIDLGTELLATRNTSISTLIHPEKGAVRGTLLYDSNNVKNYWFEHLLTKFSTNKSKSTIFETLTYSTSVDCPTGSQCYLYSEAIDQDIHIPKGYVCDKPTLIISSKDIYIDPNINSGTELSGCIFLAQNNIYIGAGDYKSTEAKIMYDYIEGFLIADNQVIFPMVDISKTLRDGIEVFGGIVALGSDTDTSNAAVSIERNLRLFNQTNPSLVLTYDNKYSSIASLFFGIEATIYRQEVGFKSF